MELLANSKHVVGRAWKISCKLLMLVKWWFPNFACGAWKMVVGGSDLLAACQLWSHVLFWSHRWLDLRVKHGWSWLCPRLDSPLCPCSEGNGFRGTNSLSVSWSGAKQIAGLKSTTTHCYKSIKHLQLAIEPPASAAKHVNSCDQITAQLTAFTCAPNVPISKGEIPARLCPMGSWMVTRTRLFGRLDGAPCSLSPACAWAEGLWAKAAWWQRHLWLSLILLSPTL